MKSISKIAVLLIAFNSWTMIAPQKATAQVSINFQVFYDDLSPFGNWVLNASYGYVWIPDVSPNFSPYATNGHWVYTNVGWTWVSYYPWGWAPFHYGRWFYDYPYGWIWVPDYEWGPAWVVWRRSEGCYGWAPIGPGISISIAYGGSYNLPYNQWRFVRDRDFGRTNINNYYIRSSDNSRILKNSQVIYNSRIDNSNQVRYVTGPDRKDVQKRTGNTFTPIAIRESNKPGQHLSNNELQIYRPRVERSNSVNRKPMPNKVMSLNEVKDNRQSNSKMQKSQQQRYDQPVPEPQKQKHNQHQEQHAQQQPQRHDQPVPQPQRQNQHQEQSTQQQPQRHDQPVPQPQRQNQHQEQRTQQQPQRYDQPVPQPQRQNQHQEQHTQQQPQRYDQPVPQPQRQNQQREQQQEQHTHQQPQNHDQPVQQQHSQKQH
jgi:hypothetical protein